MSLIVDGDFEVFKEVFGIMQLLVNGIAKDSKVEEAKELIAQVKEEYTRNVDLWNEVEAALPH